MKKAQLNVIAAHTNTFHTYPLEVALAGIVEAGYQYVELSAVRGWTEHVDVDDDPAPTLSLLSDMGLSAVALSGHSDLTTAEGVSLAVRAIAWAQAAGLGLVTTAIGGHASQREDRATFMRSIGVIAEAAAAAGVTVALEVHGELMATGRQSAELVESIAQSIAAEHGAAAERIKIKYDTGNVEYYGGRKAVDDIGHALPYLVNIDAKDKRGGIGVWDFPAPGEGSIDWPTLVGILQAASYDGPVTVEIEFQGEPWPSASEITRALKSARTTLEPLLAGLG